MPAETYFIAWKGRRDGPFTLEQLADLLQNGEIGLLHRVETTAGLIPLRQLLLAADPARWSNLAVTPGASRTDAQPAHHTGPLGPIPTPPAATAANPPGQFSQSFLPSSASPSHPSSFIPPPSSSSQLQTLSRKLETFFSADSSQDPPEALRAYIVSGLTFLFPPLAGYAFLLANNLSARGHPHLARRLHYLYSALALTGLLFWIFLWKIW